jgi:hypothetical protein
MRLAVEQLCWHGVLRRLAIQKGGTLPRVGLVQLVGILVVLAVVLVLVHNG